MKTFTISLFLVLTFLNLQKSFANKTDIYTDSLYQIYEAAYGDDTVEFEVIFERVNTLIQITRKEKLKQLEGNFLVVKSSLLNSEGRYTEAIQVCDTAIIIANEIEDEHLLSDIYLDLGNAYDYLGFYPKAIDYQLKSIKIKESLQDSLGLQSLFNNLANIQGIVGDYDEALKNYYKSLEMAIALKDTFSIGIAYGNLASFYYEDAENMDSTMHYIQKSKKLNEIFDEDEFLIQLNGLLSDIYMEKGLLDSAMYYQKLNSRYSQEIGTQYDIINSYLSMAGIYAEMGKIKESRDEASKALSMSLNSRLKENIIAAYDLLSTIDSLTNDYKSSLYYFQQAQVYIDSVRDEDASKEALRKRLEFDFEKKEAIAAEKLKREETRRNLFLIGFLFMSIAAIIILRQRNRIEKERNRSEELLLNILPYETAQELKEKGHADSKHIDQVSVLFTDFKGFTQLSEKLSPEDLVKNIHECFSAFDKIMETYGVEKIKTIGDAYMAAGGLPTPNKTNAVDVVQAAIDIQDFMLKRADEKRAKGEPFFEIRIGVHTGPVVAGIVGIKKFQYDIWGDTVNTASRMESSGEVGRVNISEMTHSIVKDFFNFEFRGEIEAKGKGKIKMFFVSPKNELITG